MSALILCVDPVTFGGTCLNLDLAFLKGVLNDLHLTSAIPVEDDRIVRLPALLLLMAVVTPVLPLPPVLVKHVSTVSST
eukprot:1297716-Ditylum_brightwellii.AAC.1